MTRWSQMVMVQHASSSKLPCSHHFTMVFFSMVFPWFFHGEIATTGPLGPQRVHCLRWRNPWLGEGSTFLRENIGKRWEKQWKMGKKNILGVASTYLKILEIQWIIQWFWVGLWQNAWQNPDWKMRNINPRNIRCVNHKWYPFSM